MKLLFMIGNAAVGNYKYAISIAPTLNLGAEPEIGARIAIPVESIK